MIVHDIELVGGSGGRGSRERACWFGHRDARANDCGTRLAAHSDLTRSSRRRR